MHGFCLQYTSLRQVLWNAISPGHLLEGSPRAAYGNNQATRDGSPREVTSQDLSL